MKQINFVMREMTSVRYYIPLVIEANKRGIKCNFLVGKCGKYNSPHLYSSTMEKYAKEYNFWIEDISNIKSVEGVLFFVERTGLELIEPNDKQIKIILTYSGAFIEQNKTYKDKANHICMISKYFVDFYDLNSEKNLFFGTPKFDVELSANKVLEKYSLNKDSKKALVIYPRTRDLGRIDLRDIYDSLIKHNFEILVKTRGKDPVRKDFYKGDHYFEDTCWFPHTTIELMKVSDVVINFGSGAIKECAMMGVPVIDFYIKPFRKLFAPLYEYDYARNYTGEFNIEDFGESLEYLTNNDFSNEFNKARKECLYDKDYNSSKNLIDFIEKEYL